MTTEVETWVRPAHLLEYNRRALKLVGIGKNGLPCIKWGPIYDDPDYWTDEELVKKASDFKYGVATVFGLTRSNDEQGSLYLNNLDIDSDAVYDKLFILQNPGPKYSLIKKIFEEGFVVKTKKTKGHQIYWLSHKQHKPIHTQDCKPGYEFEIHTDKSSGTGMLPLSRHRNDADFEYKFKVANSIPISDDAYDVILEVLKDCLVPQPEEQPKQDSGSKEQSFSGNGESTGLELTEDDVQRITEPIQPYYRDGVRHNIVFSLSCLLRRQGIPKDSVFSVIEFLAEHDGISQESDVMTALIAVEDVFIEDINIIAGNEYFKHLLYSITGSRDKANDIFTKVFDIIYEVRSRRKSEEQESLEEWLKCNVMTEYKIHTMNDLKELFLYDEKRGVYLAKQEWRIEAFCQSIYRDIKTGTISEVINRVKRWSYIDRSKFDSDIDTINLKNGLLNIHTLDFIDRQLTDTSNHLSTVQLPIKYNPKARCPKILKFLSEILKPEDIRVVLQLIGYCLYKTNKYEKWFIFFGQGSNGKSTLIHLIEHFLGYEDNISHQTLQKLATNRFSTAELFRKSANICADIGNKKISNEHIGIVKMLASGDRASAERKGKDPFDFTPFAKLIFSANEIPEIEDKTYSTWRRLILLEFENVFEENKNVNLINELTTEEEMSGLLNVALIALKRLIKNNKFDYTKDVETVRKVYELNSNVKAKFAEEKLVECDVKDHVSTRDVNDAFAEFCKKEKRPCQTDAQLGTYLAMHFAGRWGGKHRKRINGEEVACYFGIRLRAKDETKLA